MDDKEEEFKLAVSMLKALSGVDALTTVPKPNGRTNLIGKIKKIVESPDFGEQELIIITDGFDNQHDITDFQVGVTESGEARIVTINKQDYTSNDEYMVARQEAILDYLNYIGAQVHIIGIGNEVKKLLSMAASRPMTVAHVPQSATASQVASIVGAAINIVRNTAVPAVDFASTEDHTAATNARIITVDNLCGQQPLAEEQIEAVKSESSLVYVGDDALTPEAFKEAFAKAEDASTIADSAKKYTRGVVMWLLCLSLKQGKVPGAVIGGKLAKVFKPPDGAGEWKVNKLLSELKTTGLVTSETVASIKFVVNGHSREFTKVACYEVSPRAAHLAVKMAKDAEWATPETELVLNSKKRKHQADESSKAE